VAVGPRPDARGVDRLRKAGLRFACFEPWTDSELRFILNRAIYDPSRARISVRDGLRVPTNLMGRVFGGTGEKPVLVYNVSLGGAYLETHRPSSVGARIEVELPLEPEPLRLQARVVSTNVPGNMRRPNLPLGMGVRFETPDAEATERLTEYVSRRASQFEL
ncbi:MAG: PilZ domain-containing protein, partial [Myxococcota bacterium]|nr:PilZ domain-containing protein [Myxococcota bacterium]